MIMFDFQDKSGRLPDSVNDSKVIWNYVKPPIHGWTLKKILENGMTLTKNQLTEAYSALEKQTLWWINYRDFDGDGVCEYVHGNDSGWDNSTVFATVPPIASPDLQAFLLVQMDMLAELAESLGMPQESDNWKARFEKASSNFWEKCFVNGLPTAFQSGTHKVVENQSLLPYGMARRTIKRLYRDKDNRIVSAMTNWEIRQKQKWCLLLMVELCAGLLIQAWRRERM